jgi:hypothetical protein
MNQISHTIPISPRNPPTAPPTIGPTCFPLVVPAFCCTGVGAISTLVGGTVEVTTTVLTKIEPSARVDDVCSVTITGGGVTTDQIDVVTATGGGWLLHEANNVLVACVCVTGIVTVTATCTVDTPPERKGSAAVKSTRSPCGNTKNQSRSNSICRTNAKDANLPGITVIDVDGTQTGGVPPPTGVVPPPAGGVPPPPGVVPPPAGGVPPPAGGAPTTGTTGVPTTTGGVTAPVAWRRAGGQLETIVCVVSGNVVTTVEIETDSLLVTTVPNWVAVAWQDMVIVETWQQDG